MMEDNHFRRFRIFNPEGTNNEYVLVTLGYQQVTCFIRLISLLKYSGTDLKKETLINLLKTNDGCKLIKKMIDPHIQELPIPTLYSLDKTSLGFYNFSDNRIKWMRKNIISPNLN